MSNNKLQDGSSYASVVNIHPRFMWNTMISYMLSQEEIQKLIIVGILFLVVCLFARFVYMLVIETFGFPMVNKQPSILAGMMAPSGRHKCNSMGINLVVKFRLELCNYQMLYKLQITANSTLFYKQCFYKMHHYHRNWGKIIAW